MELGMNKKQSDHGSRQKTLHELTGWTSFVCGIIAMAGLNVSYLMLSLLFLPAGFYYLSLIGIGCALLSLFTRGSKTNAWWGLGLNIFVFLFTLTMLVLGWNINPQP